MSFCGSEFIFNGTSSLEFGLYLYQKMSDAAQDAIQFVAPSFKEDKPLRRFRSLCYGSAFEDNLTFKLVFGANPELLGHRRTYDRFDIEKIASWLILHDDYKWLYIVQDDMENIRYRCKISNLKSVEVGGNQLGFQCTVTCDSPFGYMKPQTFSYHVNGSASVLLKNRSSYNGYYLPRLRIRTESGGDFSIANQSDGGNMMKFTGVPLLAGALDIDQENQVVTSGAGLNVYPYWNFKYLRLVRGDNQLRISGTGDLDIICEFPVNVGG